MAHETLTSELQNYELFGKERVSEMITTYGILSRRTLRIWYSQHPVHVKEGICFSDCR